MLFISSIVNEQSPWEADGTLAVINQSWLQCFCEGIKNWAVKALLLHALPCRRFKRCLMCTESVFVCLVQTDPCYNSGQVLIAPSEASYIDVERTKITVSSDPFVRGASIKVAEWGLHIELCFIVMLSRSELSVHTHSYMLRGTVHYPARIFPYTFSCTDKKSLIKIPVKFWRVVRRCVGHQNIEGA